MSEENPTFYEELKSKKFIIDGYELPTYSILNMASYVKDDEFLYQYVQTLPITKANLNIDIYKKTLFKYFINTTDISAAKAKCREIENLYILNNMEIPSEVQAISKLLTSRLIESKLK
jgi:hypothetical protein